MASTQKEAQKYGTIKKDPLGILEENGIKGD